MRYMTQAGNTDGREIAVQRWMALHNWDEPFSPFHNDDSLRISLLRSVIPGQFFHHTSRLVCLKLKIINQRSPFINQYTTHL